MLGERHARVSVGASVAELLGAGRRREARGSAAPNWRRRGARTGGARASVMASASAGGGGGGRGRSGGVEDAGERRNRRAPAHEVVGEVDRRRGGGSARAGLKAQCGPLKWRIRVFTSMTKWHEDSLSVARQARGTTAAATVEGQKESCLWFRSESKDR